MGIEFRRILAPIDFSENAASVLDWAAHLAKEHGSRILLLHVYHLPVEFQQLEGAYLPPDFWANVKAEAEQSLNRYQGELEQRGIEVEGVVREGFERLGILQFEDHDPEAQNRALGL